MIQAFTTQFNDIPTAIVTDCQLALPGGKFIPVQALWDTGANMSAIALPLANLLLLTPIGHIPVHTSAGQIQLDLFRINIILPNQTLFHHLVVTGAHLTNTQLLIGMDVIAKGDTAISHHENNTVFSFQMPTTHHIDFTNNG
jgi:hypothetical protein